MKLNTTTGEISNTKLHITAGELATLYVDLGQYFLCDTLARLAPGWRPVSSARVIEQFVKAKPERFYTDVLETWNFNDAVTCTVISPMKMKYFRTTNPRLNLLKSIPPEHEFEFPMEKITNKG